MANRHAAKLADVHKHLGLTEILAVERPARYWESHAGNATYRLDEDPERRYGALGFAEVASAAPALARSRYSTHLQAELALAGGAFTYPGSPMLAMLELGTDCSYLFCDLEGVSTGNLRVAAERLGLGPAVRVLEADGMTALNRALAGLADEDIGTVVAHIDPYDPRAVGPDGITAIDLARLLLARGVGVVCWYGYSRPEDRAWLFDELRGRAPAGPVWCGDVMVASPGTDPGGGDLGAATTPGTGFGLVCANVSTEAVTACRNVSEALVAAYEHIPLPDGSPGCLDFTTRLDG